MEEFTVGRPTSEYVTVRVLRREREEDQDYWDGDGNWLTCEVHIQAGAWRGGVTANLRAEEFVLFREALEALQGPGHASFEPMEPWLELNLERDGLGHVTVSGEAIDYLGWGNRVIFKLRDMDQTDLPALIRQLRQVETAFPVRGHPSEPPGADAPKL